MSERPAFTSQLTADGSLTFFSEEFDEAFHSHYGAKQEAEYKFVSPCQVAKKAVQQKTFKLLDICYGLGYNSAAALSAIWAANDRPLVELIALESNLAVPQQAIAQHLLDPWPSPIPALLQTLADKGEVQTERLQARLLLGDARKTLPSLSQSGWQADAIFLDPFSPPKCPQLWTVEFLAAVAACLHPTGRLATYSSAAAVRMALKLAGLQIGSTLAVGRRSPGTVASYSLLNLPPLSQKEREALATRSAIPYRDPQLCATAAEIRQQRRQQQCLSDLEPTTRWKKRWSGKGEQRMKDEG